MDDIATNVHSQITTDSSGLDIHSGDALLGSMGSAERIEHAVIGDTVNCASRLESLDKSRHD
jgi:adenylate cyclase